MGICCLPGAGTHPKRCDDVANFKDSTVEINNKNKVEKVGVFSDPKKCPSIHHDLPAIHHNFTTKNHVKNALFGKTPCKNAPPPRNKKPGL
jgi:hypothetical protein